MKLTKQTVYLLKEEVNLEENYYLQDLNSEFYLEQKGYFLTPEQLNEYTENVIKEALKTSLNEVVINDYDEHEQYSPHIDKDSILNTFEEIFNKFKV